MEQVQMSLAIFMTVLYLVIMMMIGNGTLF